MALADPTEDPRLQKARERRQTYLLDSAESQDRQQAKDAMFTPTADEEALRRINNSGGNAWTDLGHKMVEGATFGASPYLAGVGSAIMGGDYAGARDAERQRLADLQTQAPGASTAAKFAGMAATSPALELVPGLKGLRSAGEHLVTKGVASSAGRAIAGRVAGSAAENMVLGGGMSAATAAAENPGGPLEKLKAGVQAIPSGEVGGIALGGALAGAGEAAGAATDAVRSSRAAAQAAREAPIWKNMPVGEVQTPAQRAYLEAGDARANALAKAAVAEADARYAARTAAPVDVPPPERPPVVAPTDPMSARFRGLRRADELTAPPPPTRPSSLLTARGEPVTAPETPPVETPEERTRRLMGHEARDLETDVRARLASGEIGAREARPAMAAQGRPMPPEPSPLLLPPPDRASGPLLRSGTSDVGLSSTLPAPPSRAEPFLVGPKGEPLRRETPESTRRTPAPPARPIIMDVPAPPARAAAPAPMAPAATTDLDHLAQFAFDAQMPGRGDPTDVAVASAQIKRLSPADRATVRAKIKAIGDAQDPITGGARTQVTQPTPAPVDPLAGLPARVRDHVQAALEAKSEAELVTAASNLQGVRMTPEQGQLVQRLLEERRAALPKAATTTRINEPAATAPAVEKPATATAPAPVKTDEPMPPPSSTPEEKAQAELAQITRAAGESGKRMSMEETVSTYERLLENQRRVRGADSGGAGEAAPALPFLGGEATEQQRIADGTKRVGDTAPAPAAEAPPKRTMAEGRSSRALDQPMMHNGEQKSRQAIVEGMVSDGATVVPSATDGRRLQRPDGSFLSEKQIGKTAMDYAEAYADKRGSGSRLIEDARLAMRGDDPRRAALEHMDPANLSEADIAALNQAHEPASTPVVHTPESGVQTAVTPEARAPEQAAPEAPAVPQEPRKPLTGPRGAPTTLNFADAGKEPAHYRVAEAADLIPSHNPETWQPRADYPANVQGRQYHLDKTAQEQFEGRLAKYDPSKPLDLTSEVGSGPPTVTPEGVAVAGNERTMLLQRLAKERPAQYAAYRAMLEERAQQLGLDPAEIKGMTSPVLVRELEQAPADEAALREMNRRSDVPVGKEKNPISDAATRAARMQDAHGALEHLADPERGINTTEGETLRAYLTTPRGKAFVDQLVTDRVIEPSELAKFRDPATGAMTEQGLDTIERTLEAAAIGDPQVASLARANVPGVLNKMEHAFPALVRASADPGWSLGPRLQEALKLHIQAKDVPGGKLEDLLGQGALFGGEHNPDAVALARFLDRSSKSDVKLAAHRYAQQAGLAERMGQSDDLFGAAPPSPAQAFKETFGRTPDKPALVNKPKAQTRRDAGFASSVILRPIAGAGAGGLYGGTQGDTTDERIKNIARYAMLGAGISLAPEITSGLMRVAKSSELGEAAIRAAKKATMKSADYIESVGGAAGHYLADDIRQIDMRSTFRYGRQHVDAAKALEGLDAEEQILAKKYADSRPSAANAPEHVKQAGEALRAVLDRDKDEAAKVGITTSAKTGHAYPQVPTTEAIEALRALSKVGVGDAKVQDLVAAMVKDNIAKTPDEAVEKLLAYQAKVDGRGEFRTPTVGMNPYLESSRFQLPEDYVDWGNNAALKSAMRRNATTIEAARQWGPRHEATRIYLDGVSKDAGRDVAADVQGYLSHDFGGVALTDKAHSKLVGAFSNYETATKLGNFLSPFLNYGQQFANLAHLPLDAQLKAFKAYPPLIGRYLKEGAALRQWAEESGVVYGHTAMADVPQGVGGKITNALLSGFVKAAKSNEVRTAIASRYALESDLQRVMEANPDKTSGLGKFLDVISGNDVTHGADGALEGAPVRRLEKLGIDRNKLADIMASGRRLSEGEMLEAAYRLVHDTQFPMTVASKPIWWSRSPVARLAAKFKPFAMRQTQYIYENVLKEAARGNVAPVAKFVTAATMTGEMYHIARDLVLGSDKSVAVHAIKNDGDTSHIGKRMLEDFAAQGGLGLLWDLQYGLSNWVGGPVVSSFNNLTDALAAGSDAVSKGRWGQLPATALEFAKSEATGVRQLTGVYDRVKAAAMGDSPYAQYVDLKADALRSAGASEDPSEFMGQAVGKMLRGQATFETTVNTLPYRSATAAIQAGDPQKAADHLAVILKDAPSLTDAIGTARATLSRRGPLGGLSAEQRRTYLGSLDQAKRDAAVRLNLRWQKDSEAAIRAAVTKSRQP